MLEKSHNEISKQFMQKILTYIDSVFINSSNSNSEDASKVLVSGLLNVRDAILSEIIRDNQIVDFNKILQREANKKKGEDLKSLNQEKELAKDQ